MRALELVGETLRAATADPELRELVLSGRVEREQSAATLGTPEVGRPPRRDPASAKRREVATARRELKRLEGALAEATAREERLRGRVEQTAEALREEKRRLSESKREAAGLKRKVEAAERRARGREE
jgi:chromosome segregation ATPase